MKIVNVGDILISPEAMARATANFERYDEVKNFYFGPRDKDEFRMYPQHSVSHLFAADGSLCSQKISKYFYQIFIDIIID